MGIIVSKDSKYDTFEKLIEDALENPGKISIATTSKGGMPWSVAAFIGAVTGAEFYQIPFDSDASARIAVLGGYADFTACKLQAGIDGYHAGELKYLTLLSSVRADGLPDVPAVTEDYPEFQEYVPWGPFYGVFVKKGTPDSIIEQLGDAFEAAFQDDRYRSILQSLNVNPLGYRGKEASEYLAEWQQNTTDALYAAGAIDILPDK